MTSGPGETRPPAGQATDDSGPIPVARRVPNSAALSNARRALLDLRERQAARDRAEIQPVKRDRQLPLSAAQQRLWFLDQWMGDRPVYNAPLMLRVRGAVEVAALRRALTGVVGRHEVLRTRYLARGGVPYQVVDPAPEQAELPVVDLTTTPDKEQRYRECMTEFARKPFDLEHGPVLRALLVRLADEDHGLGICIHHVATDGWSAGIFIRELSAGYQAALTGTQPDLPDLPVQYADYAAWQRAETAPGSKQLEYWRTRLASLPMLDMPADYPRPAELTFQGQTLTSSLPAGLREALTALARREQVTMLTVLLAGFVALLTRLTGQDDIVVGSIFSGRTRPEIAPLIGFFANTLVLRTSAAEDPEFGELLARTRDTVLGAHLNQDVNFDTLVEELSPERDPSRNPLFQVCFSMQDAAPAELKVGGVTITQEPVQVGTSRFDLAVHVTEVTGRGLELWMEFSTELFEPARMHQLPDQYAQVLSQVTADPRIRISELNVITPADEERALRAAVAPVRFDRGAACLHELFENQAAATPDAVACRFLGVGTTYGKLNRRANRLARMLRERGARPETVVGVLLDRGPALVTSLLAVLKSGAAYLPFDPTHPAERISYAARDAGCELVITSGRFAGLLPEGVPFIALDDPEVGGALDDLPGGLSGGLPGGLPGGDLGKSAAPGNAAYLIYTSGSTGRPKGVVVEHRQIVNFVLAVTEMFRLSADDHILQFANPAFDTSAFDFFASLSNGATLIQAPIAMLHNPATLTMVMRDEGVTVTDLPPTVLAELDPGALPALRALFVGMEPFPAELVNRWSGPAREFHNGYGPTEATVACIDYLCPDKPLTGAPPIGQPMPNYTAYVLDGSGALVPAGVTGELYVGGAGVARGYHGQPGLTADRFVPDPFGPPGARLYRTGDLARRAFDGVLTFQGRADSQIKIRGMRIEPAEIEMTLLEHDDVQQAIVIAHVDTGPARLVAYVIPAPGASPEPESLRDHVSAKLPAFMTPAAVMVLDAFPKNVNGKVDRSRLPVPDTIAGSVAARVQPRTATERRLAGIWCDILGLPEIGVDDDFFALGGSSLKFAQVAARVREAFPMVLELRELFAKPTVAGLASLIASQGMSQGVETQGVETQGVEAN